MNVESLKSELQQVLNNDLILRKEYAELRRSLSDYRNQLIMRDEDCKRLQVTIDVLNTKLSVLDRDNGTYKAELAALKETQGRLGEELLSRQREIESAVAESESLRDELKRVIADYEGRLDSMRMETGEQLSRLQQQYAAEVQDLRSGSESNQTGIREDYEARILAMREVWAEQEHGLQDQRVQELQRLKNDHAEEMFLLREQYNSTLTALSSNNHEQLAELKVKYETTILDLEQKLSEGQHEVRERYTGEIEALKSAIGTQRLTLAAEFDANLEAMAAEYATREGRLRAGYESRIEDLKQELSGTTEELAFTLETRVSAVKAAHDDMLRENTLAYESRIADLINLYEEKISNLLIHSNASNSRLSNELNHARAEHEQTGGLIETLQGEIQSRDFTIADLATRIGELEMQLNNEQERLLSSGVDVASQNSREIEEKEEELARLNDQLVRLNHAHSDYVSDLNATICSLNEEVQNMSQVFGTMTNSLSAAERELDLKNADLEKANARIAELEQIVAERENSVQQSGRLLVTDYEQKLSAQKLEFEKLLVENAAVISEIEETQRQLDIRQSEIDLLRSELDEVKASSGSRVEELRETLNSKNFEITGLEGSRAALEKELELLKQEVNSMAQNVTSAEQLNGEIHSLRATVSELTALSEGLNEKLGLYENELSALRGQASATEHEAFIDKLFKQIDTLNAQRITLLDEKEQMAAQLLKMNEVIGSMSQHIEAEEIDVSGLNNHRKNVILAANSKGAGNNAPMKKQINELVREIDKCIALLSA